jgi:transcriptional regulator with XRE-family HTH domain
MAQPNLMKARQIKAARALLGWYQEDLAHASGLSVATIRNLELGFIARSDTMTRVRGAFEENGLEFMEPDGVRHRQENITTYLGSEGAVAFFDDIQRTVRKKEDEIIIVSKSGSLFDFDDGCAEDCIEKLTAIKAQTKAKIKCLLTEELASPLTMTFCECRLLSKNYVDPAPLYVYGDKYAVLETGTLPKIIVIQSLSIAQSQRQQFHSMWEKAMAFRTPETVGVSAKEKSPRR